MTRVPTWQTTLIPLVPNRSPSNCSKTKRLLTGQEKSRLLLTSNDTSKALLACDRMLSVHPGNRLFEGLRLEIEKKEREVRLEFIRQLSAELERVPDLDYRIEAIQHALNRYPTESQLSQLLRHAEATRDFFTGLVAEARQEEMHERYLESLKRWNVIRILFPAMPGLQGEIHRVEKLTHTQARIKRRAEFVEAIARLCSTGEYARAVYQCVNALAEYPNDLGLLALKKSAEEKVRHSTELQQFISEGLTFLRGREADAALEAFAKARSLDQNNLQVRYLVGIALLEKARSVMYRDRQKMAALIDEAKILIPDHPELQALSSELVPLTDGSAEQPAVLDGPSSVGLAADFSRTYSNGFGCAYRSRRSRQFASRLLYLLLSPLSQNRFRLERTKLSEGLPSLLWWFFSPSPSFGSCTPVLRKCPAPGALHLSQQRPQAWTSK